MTATVSLLCFGVKKLHSLKSPEEGWMIKWELNSSPKGTAYKFFAVLRKIYLGHYQSCMTASPT